MDLDRPSDVNLVAGVVLMVCLLALAIVLTAVVGWPGGLLALPVAVLLRRWWLRQKAIVRNQERSTVDDETRAWYRSVTGRDLIE